jgi:hypothetical protein
MRLYNRLSLLVITLLLLTALSGNTFASAKDKKNKDPQKQEQTGAKIDLNTASEKELDSLPGVGPATVKKIVSNRPYSSVDDLKKAGVGQGQIEKIRSLVTVSSSPASSSQASDAGSKARPEKETGSSRETSSLPQSDNQQATTPPSGSGMVWVNLDSKIYHREGDRWYGKTKHGKYMTESDAQKAGYRAAKNGK